MIHYLYFLFTLLIFGSFNPTLTRAGAFAPNIDFNALGSSGMPDLEEMERELAKAAQEIDQFVASLPPEEQALFHEQVKVVENMIENMSEEEFNQLLEGMLQEMPQPEAPIAKPAPEVKVEAPKLTAEQTRKQETALSLLESLINHTESFMVKTQTITDLPGVIDRLILQKKIESMPENTLWAPLEKDIELLDQKFHALLDKDPKNKSFRYLIHLVDNETVFNQLSELNTILIEQEPKIDVPDFSFKKINTKVKDALQKVVSAYNIQLTVNTIIKSLDELIEKYNPEAKKLKEEEAKTAQRAAQERKAPMGSTVIAGQAENRNRGNQNFASDYGNYNDYYGGNNYGNYGNYGDYGDYGNYNDQFGGGSEGGKGAKGAAGGKGQGGKKGAEESKDRSKEDTKKDKVGVTDPLAERYLGQFEESLETINEFFQEYPIFKKIKEHILSDKETVDIVLSDYIITRFDRTVNNAAKQLEALNRHIAKLSDGVKEHYKKEVKTLFDRYKKQLQDLESSLSSLESNWSELKKEVTQSKKYAYFKEGELPKVEQQSSQNNKAKPTKDVIDDFVNNLSEGDQKAFNEQVELIEDQIEKEKAEKAIATEFEAAQAKRAEREAEYKQKRQEIENLIPLPEEFTASTAATNKIRQERDLAFNNLRDQYSDTFVPLKKPEREPVEPKTDKTKEEAKPLKDEQKATAPVVSSEKGGQEDEAPQEEITPEELEQLEEKEPAQQQPTVVPQSSRSLFDLLNSIKKLIRNIDSFVKMSKK